MDIIVFVDKIKVIVVLSFVGDGVVYKEYVLIEVGLKEVLFDLY